MFAEYLAIEAPRTRPITSYCYIYIYFFINHAKM